MKHVGLYGPIIVDPTAWAVDTVSTEANPKWKALLQYRPFTSQHPHLKLRKEWIPEGYAGQSERQGREWLRKGGG